MNWLVIELIDSSNNQQEIKKDTTKDIFNELILLKNSLVLYINISYFYRQCFEVNELLMSKNLYLRVYDFRKRFRYGIHKTVTKIEVIRNLSAYVFSKNFQDLKLLKN